MDKKRCWCTVCNNEFSLDKAIVLGQDDLKDISDMSAFKRNCPVCKKLTLFRLPMMYQDIGGDNGVFIWMNPQPADAPQGLVRQFLSVGIAGGVHRVVDTPLDMIDKIEVLYTREYDDRAVEIVKFLAAVRVLREQPNLRPDLVFFRTGKSAEDDYIVIYGANGAKTSVPFIHSMYETVRLQYIDDWKRRYGNNAMKIDAKWANDYMSDKMGF